MSKTLIFVLVSCALTQRLCVMEENVAQKIFLGLTLMSVFTCTISHHLISAHSSGCGNSMLQYEKLDYREELCLDSSLYVCYSEHVYHKADLFCFSILVHV